MKKLLTILLLLVVGASSSIFAQTAVTMGSQVTDASNIVSGKAYLLQHQGNGTNKPWLEDAGNYYNCPNSAGNCNQASVWYLIDNGDGTWKIENAYTGKYWPKPTGNANLVGTDAANAGNWTLNFSDGIAAPTCNGYRLNRSTPYLVGWNSGSGSVTQVKIFEVTASTLATSPTYSAFADKDISVSGTEASSISEGQWYVMKNRGRNGYAFENSGSMKNQAAAPSGTATNNAKFLVRFLNAGDGKYYLQNGLGNYWGAVPQNTAVPATAVGTEKYTVGEINSTNGHFYLTSETNGIVLDCQENGYPVVGWGTSIPTSTGGNSDWAFFPVEFVESWVPTASEVYTINNTNANRGALIYNPDASTKYVWSSGKSGTFDASNANSQWVIIPSGTSNQYYLYNVGAGKFAIPTAIAQGSGNSWIFSDNAVAVIFETQGDGTKKIKMASTPVSGTNAAYMAVSNNYTGPIINYNDVGGNFTITKVDGQDQSTAANAAVAKLVSRQTALTGSVTADDGWYVIRIKTTSNSTATASPGRFIYPGTTNQANYPLTFTGSIDVQPAISDVTFYTRFVKNGSDYNWQMTNGRYLINSNNVFPTSSSESVAVVPGYDNGSYIKSNGRFADPYVSNSNFFIGETASYRTTWSIYPIDLTTAGLVAWQIVCDAAPESAQIICSRADVVGQNTVYKNGFFFFPTGVTPGKSDFTLEGAYDVDIDATAHTITFAYDPNLAMVEGSVIVAQGWQTAGRDSEVMLLKVTASPFKDATGVSLTASLKDGSEANISTLKLYEASTSSPEIYSTGDGAPTKTVVATATISGSTATFSIGNLSAGTHYYWLGATVKDNATLGAVLDAAVTSITYTCNSNETTLDLTAVGDPADRGAMVFNAHSYPFLPRDNGSRVYRIPAMVVAEDGSIVVAADKRYQSHTDIGNGGHVIDIVVRRSTDGGKTWSAPVTIAKGEGSTASGGDDKRCGFGDPSLVKGKDGKLYCLFAAGNEGYFYGQKGMCMSVSTDNGVTWSSGEGNPPVDLYWSGAIKNVATAGAAGFGLYDYFVTSGRGLYIPEDDILMYLIPAQTMTSETEHTGDSQDYVFYSRDGGESWYFSETPMVQGGDEAKIIQMNDGSLFGSIRKGGNRRFNTATYTKNNDGTLSFEYGTQWDNNQLTQSSQNNQDILYYQRETATGKKDFIFHSITTGNHANFKLYYSTDQGNNWTEFLTVQTKGTRYVTMDKSGTDENPGSLYLFFEDQSLNSAGGYTDYNHYPLNFIEITREQLLQYIPDLEKSALYKDVNIVQGTTGEATYGSWNNSTWTSKAASGVAGLTMTLSDGSYNRFSSYNGRYNLAYHPAAANTNSTITLTAPDGYVITGYSVQTGVYQAATYTLTPSGGTPVSPANLGSTYTSINVSDLFTTSTSITVSTTDATKWLCFTNFVVTICPIDYAVNLNVVGGKSYATIYLPFGITLPDEVTAYKIAVDGKNAIPTSMGQELPANTPALLISETGVTEATATINAAATADASGNVLAGTTSVGYVSGYVLNAVDNQIGFYKLASTGSLAANRAYIPSSIVVGNQIKAFLLSDGTETGVGQTEAPEDDETYYSLSGVKVKGKPIVKGVFIQPGRKYVVK